jgi:hypothetical protein
VDTPAPAPTSNAIIIIMLVIIIIVVVVVVVDIIIFVSATAAATATANFDTVMTTIIISLLLLLLLPLLMMEFRWEGATKMHTSSITIDAGTIIDCCSFDHCYCYWERCDGFEKKKNDRIVVNATGRADALPRRRRSRVPLLLPQ